MINNIIKNINKLNKLNNIQFVFIIVTILFLIFCVFKPKSHVESMSIQKEKYEFYENNNLFDKFYSEIYDDLVHVPSKNIYELSKIQSKIKKTK